MRRGFTETWTLLIHDPKNDLELTLDLSALMSRNGFREIAETRATLRVGTLKNLIRNPIALSSSNFSKSSPQLSIQNSELDANGSRGLIQNKGRTMAWDVQWKSAPEQLDRRWTWLSSPLLQILGTESQLGTLWRARSVSGTLRTESQEWTLSSEATCSLVHSHGRKNWRDSVSVLAPQFQEESGKPSDLQVEGAEFGSNGYALTRWMSPRVFRIEYKGRIFSINSPIQSLQTRSHSQFPSWTFETHAGGYRFAGEFTGELKNAVGIALENTNGKIQYLTRLLSPKGTVRVYRGGKLEGRFHTLNGAALEFRTASPIPYVGSYL